MLLLRRRPEATPRVGWYVLVQFLVFAPSVTVLVRLRTTMTWWELGVGAAMVAFGQLVLIALLESKRWARAGEITRLMMLATATGWVTWSYAPERLRLAIVAAMGVFVIVSMAAFAWSLRATQEFALGVDGSRAAST